MAFTPLSRTGWVATASSQWDSSLAPSKAIDGVTSTCWHCANGDLDDGNADLMVDMGSAQSFNAIQILPRQITLNAQPTALKVYVSSDGSTWGSSVGTFTGIPVDHSQPFTLTLPAAQTARHIKVNVNASESAGVCAIAEFYAGATTDPNNPATSAGQATVSATGYIGASAIRQTQEILEVALVGPAAAVNGTQAALETVSFPPNAIWATQVCLEVLFPAGWCPPCPPATGKRNHSFIGTSFSLQ